MNSDVTNIMRKRLLFDTNILLTGFFVPQSKSFQVIKAVQRGDLQGYVLQNSIDEAEGVVARAAKETGIDFYFPFHDSLKISGLVLLPKISQDAGASYPDIKGKGDRLLVAGAKNISADIVTNDFEDFQHSHRYGIKAWTPTELTNDGTLGIHTLSPGIYVTPHQGTFFVDIGALNWSNTKYPEDCTELFYLFDCVQIGACFYEAKSNSFVYQPDNGPRLTMHHGPVQSGTIKVVVTYNCTSGADLYFGTTQCVAIAASWQPLPFLPGSLTYIGSDRNNCNQLSGSIRTVSGLPYQVNKRAAMNLINGVTVDNPWERLSLETMIKLLVLGG